MAVLLPIAYLPPIEWFAHLAKGDALVEMCDHYVKQTYRNRCHIATADGLQALTIPVSHTGQHVDGQTMALGADVGISEQASWRRTHWQALVSAYRMSPFFEYYADDLKPYYDTPRTESLYEYNVSLIRTLCRLMHLNVELRLTTHYRKPEDCAAEGIVDLREAIHPKREGTLPHPTPYYQLFASKNGFLPNLSIVDLLFNMGPETLCLLMPKQ